MSNNSSETMALIRDDYFQATDNVSKGDIVQFQLRDKREFEGEVTYVSRIKPRSNALVVLKVSQDEEEGYLSVESSGRIVKHSEDKEPEEIIGRLRKGAVIKN